MSYLIKAPEIPVAITGENGKVVETQNYFWLMIRSIINQYANKATGLQLLDLADFYKIVKSQVGQSTLAIEKTSDYEFLKKLVEQHSNWLGTNAAEDAPKVILAIRNAEKL